MVTARRTKTGVAIAAAVVLALASCAPRVTPALRVPDLTLPDTAGASHSIRREAATARLTVVSFFSAHCPCQTAHDARLRELYARYHGAGVAFLAVDSEVTASATRDAREHDARAYPFPIAEDRGAELARALGASYATYTVVLDAEGRVRYHGGIDSDRTHLRPDARAYLREAVEALLAGREPPVTSSEALGCALQTW